MKVLILGASGMLGNAVYRRLVADPRYEARGTVRSRQALGHFTATEQQGLIIGVDALNQENLIDLLAVERPDVVINCVGLIKQLDNAKDPLAVLPINALLPHRLAGLAKLANTRLIHISTDCVFAGRKGMYVESDASDAEDLYGKSKYIGELHDVPHAVTLRTSIIGHELSSHKSLIDWFLSQQQAVKGFRKAIFSGLPTAELARVIADYVVPDANLQGLYHVSAEPIDKYSLLKLVAKYYNVDTEIVPDDAFEIDRSLDSTRFRQAVNYMPPSWDELVVLMRDSK